jgi:hypothetical protein
MIAKMHLLTRLGHYKPGTEWVSNTLPAQMTGYVEKCDAALSQHHASFG